MIQQPFFSGHFYPKQKKHLLSLIESFNKKQLTIPPSDIKGLIVPHAGYIYSGQQAIDSFTSLNNKKYETVVIICPSHRYSFNHCACLDALAYNTPLGQIPINTVLAKNLCKAAEVIRFNNNFHEEEHGIEVILPFIQYFNVAKNIIPLVVGSVDTIAVEQIVSLLEQECNPATTLIISSTDFSHFFKSSQAEKNG